MHQLSLYYITLRFIIKRNDGTVDRICNVRNECQSVQMLRMHHEVIHTLSDKYNSIKIIAPRRAFAKGATTSRSIFYRTKYKNKILLINHKTFRNVPNAFKFFKIVFHIIDFSRSIHAHICTT